MQQRHLGDAAQEKAKRGPPYVCHLCGRECKTGAGLASHMRGHERTFVREREEGRSITTEDGVQKEGLEKALAEKFSLVVKPTQSGKTFELIHDVLDKNADDANACHIIFTQNTILNNEQCAVRLADKWVELFGRRAAQDEVVMVTSKPGGNLPCRVAKK
ncbi:unnamed protein product [Amoebophrya sp. A25]|nr:unnamed protein product [Amoebophrya sp. A25]|eukprot:GSA25T00004275001.1